MHKQIENIWLCCFDFLITFTVCVYACFFALLFAIAGFFIDRVAFTWCIDIILSWRHTDESYDGIFDDIFVIVSVSISVTPIPKLIRCSTNATTITETYFHVMRKYMMKILFRSVHLINIMKICQRRKKSIKCVKQQPTSHLQSRNLYLLLTSSKTWKRGESTHFY